MAGMLISLGSLFSQYSDFKKVLISAVYVHIFALKSSIAT